MATETSPAPFSNRIKRRFEEDIAANGQPSNILISSAIDAMAALEAKQTAMFESQGRMLGMIETLAQGLSKANSVSETHNDALQTLLAEVKKLRADAVNSETEGSL